MDATEEIIVYDAMAALQENSATLAALVNRCGTDREKKAYKSGVYAACIKLQCVLGIEAMKNGSERHREIQKQAEAYFANGEVSDGER